MTPTPVPLLGPSEKAELEKLILEQFVAHFAKRGGSAFLDPKLRVVVEPSGVNLDHGETADPLAAIEVRALFTALCYTTSGTESMPRDALDALATEATSAAAAAINRLAGD